MNKDTLTVEQVAKKLGKSTRQVMRYVRDGTLAPVAGGGRGVPYAFEKTAVDALETHSEEIEVLARAHGACVEMARWVLWKTAAIETTPMSGFAAWLKASDYEARQQCMKRYVRRWPKSAKLYEERMEEAQGYAQFLNLGELRWMIARLVAMGMQPDAVGAKAISILKNNIQERVMDTYGVCAKDVSGPHISRESNLLLLLLLDDVKDYEATFKLVKEYKDSKRHIDPVPIQTLKANTGQMQKARKEIFINAPHNRVADLLGLTRMQEYRIRKSIEPKIRHLLESNTVHDNTPVDAGPKEELSEVKSYLLEQTTKTRKGETYQEEIDEVRGRGR